MRHCLDTLVLFRHLVNLAMADVMLSFKGKNLCGLFWTLWAESYMGDWKAHNFLFLQCCEDCCAVYLLGSVVLICAQSSDLFQIHVHCTNWVIVPSNLQQWSFRSSPIISLWLKEQGRGLEGITVVTFVCSFKPSFFFSFFWALCAWRCAFACLPWLSTKPAPYAIQECGCVLLRVCTCHPLDGELKPKK